MIDTILSVLVVVAIGSALFAASSLAIYGVLALALPRWDAVMVAWMTVADTPGGDPYTNFSLPEKIAAFTLCYDPGVVHREPVHLNGRVYYPGSFSLPKTNTH